MMHSSKKTIQAELPKRPRFLVFVLALVFCLALLMCVILFISRVNRPALRYELDLTSGSFCLSDGTQISPAEDGSLPVARGDTLYIQCALPGVYNGEALVLLNATGVDTALLVDGRLIVSPSGRFDPEQGFPRDNLPVLSSEDLDGLCTIHYEDDSHMTVAVQFLSAQPSLDTLPRITLSSPFVSYQSEMVNPDFLSALFAGLFLAAGGILLFVFLLMLWLGYIDFSILLLAVTALSLCALRLALCSNLMTVSAYPELILLAKNLANLPLMWLLWLKLTPDLIKKLMFLLVLISTSAMSVLLFRQLTTDAQLLSSIGQMRYFWLPLCFFALLLVGVIDAIRHNAWYRKLFPIMGCVLLAASVMTFLFYLLSGQHRRLLAPPMSSIVLQHTIFPLQSRLTVLIVFACFVLSIMQFLHLLLENDRELQTSVLHNRLANEHAEALYRTLLETRSVRHEIRSRTEALRALCEEGDLQRIRAYVEQFCEQSQISPSLYTANILVNALVAPRFQAAQDDGIQVNAIIQVPESLPIADLDLSTVLSNLLDNAVVAASSTPVGQPRELTFRMDLDRGRLHIFCRNSYAGTIRMKSDGLPASQGGEWHGYGMRLVRQAVKKYDGFLEVQYDDHSFTVRAVMLMPTDPKFS